MKSIRKILVALDASPASLAVAEAAAELAADTRAEIVGLFVEDVKLLQVCESPLGRELDPLTVSFRRPESRSVAVQLRVQAARARHGLMRIAERRGVNWSFRVVRGAVPAEIAAAAAEADLVILGDMGWSVRPRLRLGATARTLLAAPRVCALLLGRLRRIRPPIFVLYEGSEASRDALSIALTLGRESGKAVEVLLGGATEDALRAEVEELLGEAADRIPVVWVGDSHRRIEHEVRRRHGGLLVLPWLPAAGARELEDLLERVDCPALAVR